jgi:hypothetical protein
MDSTLAKALRLSSAPAFFQVSEKYLSQLFRLRIIRIAAAEFSVKALTAKVCGSQAQGPINSVVHLKTALPYIVVRM